MNRQVREIDTRRYECVRSLVRFTIVLGAVGALTIAISTTARLGQALVGQGGRS